MAKPTKNATLICVILSVVAALGIIVGLVAKSALVTIIFLLPTVIYEVYRTEGKSTKLASFGLLGVYILELILLIFNVEFDLASFLNDSEKYVAGYRVPLGDVKVVGPIIMAILSIVLMSRTRGKYTIWLSVIIIITSFAIVYTMDSTIFQRYIQIAIDLI